MKETLLTHFIIFEIKNLKLAKSLLKKVQLDDLKHNSFQKKRIFQVFKHFY